MPSNAADACGLLRTALRSDDPVLFLEHKRLYREPYNRSPHPGADYTIPFGSANVVKPGQNLTVITYGALVQKALLAATQIERRDPGGQHRDPGPAHAGALRLGGDPRVGGEDQPRDRGARGLPLLGLRRGDRGAHRRTNCSPSLDAPVRRVGALDTWVGYHPQLEAAILPQTETLAAEMTRFWQY